MKLSIPQLVEITNASAHFKLERLRNLCEKHVQSILSMETVFALLKHANQTSSLTIKAMGLEWALFHYPEFVGNKQGLAVLGLELFQEIVAELAPQIAVRDKVSVIRLPHTPADTIYSDYQKLYLAISTASYLFSSPSLLLLYFSLSVFYLSFNPLLALSFIFSYSCYFFVTFPSVLMLWIFIMICFLLYFYFL